MRLIVSNSNTFTQPAESCNQKLSRVVAFRMTEADYSDLAAFARLRHQSIGKIITESISYELNHYRNHFKK